MPKFSAHKMKAAVSSEPLVLTNLTASHLRRKESPYSLPCESHTLSQ